MGAPALLDRLPRFYFFNLTGMKRFFLSSLFFLILVISFPVGVLFGQDEVDCDPYKNVQYRPDLQIYLATYPTTRMGLIPARKLARLTTDIDFMIEDGDALEDIDQAIQEILDNDDFIPFNHSRALGFYLDMLPPMIEDYEPSNQERIGSYIDYLMKEEGLGIDLIARALPLLQGYWSDARIDSVASVAHAAASKMLTMYEEGSYPPAVRKKYANSGKYDERDWPCVAMLYRPFLDDLSSFMQD